MTQEELLDYALKGDHSAVQFFEELFRISQVLDDLIDGDELVGKGEILDAFWCALVILPRNHFYMRHFAELQPLVQAALVDWIDSCALETGDHHAKTLAFVLRDSLSGLVVHAAYLIGGRDWGRVVGPIVRRGLYDEPLSSYLEGHESVNHGDA